MPTTFSQACRDVASCVYSSGVSQATLQAALGPIPWPYLVKRIELLNPDRNPLVRRTDGSGGLCVTPLWDMLHTLVDLRDPWSSVFSLLYRLRDIVSRRLPQLAGVFSEVFCSGSDTSCFKASNPHAYIRCGSADCGTPCVYNKIQLESLGLFRLVADHVAGTGTHPATWCAAACAGSDDAGSSSAWWLNCGSQSTAGYNLQAPYTDNWIYEATQASTPPWPRVLLREPSFWTLVFFEEMVGTEAADRLWAKLTEKKFESLYGEYAGIVAEQLFFGKRLYMIDLYRRAVELNDGSLSSKLSRSSVRAILDSSRGVVTGWTVDPTKVNYPASYLNSISYTDFYDSLTPYTTDTRLWAGELNPLPSGDIDLPDTPVDPDVDRLAAADVPSGFPSWLKTTLLAGGVAGVLWYTLKADKKKEPR